jgi:enoyl-CoA hydratase
VSGTEDLLIERVDHVLVVTMNRPEAKNAFTPAMLVGMADAWVELNEDDDLRCAVLTGAGGSFCAGMDLKARASGDNENPYADRWAADPDLHWKGMLRAFRPTKPIVAAVEGYAVAGGTEILQGTHLRVAAASATFGLFEAKRGLFPVGGSTVRLARQISYTNALEMLLTARAYTAEEALAIGLVGHVVPDGTALDKAMELAAMVAANGPLAIEAILRSVQETQAMDETSGLARELEIGWPVFATEDAAEGPRAFAEKREPQWRRK